MGYSPWGYKESNMTEQLTQTHTVQLIAETTCVRYVKQGRRVRGKKSSELKTECEGNPHCKGSSTVPSQFPPSQPRHSPASRNTDCGLLPTLSEGYHFSRISLHPREMLCRTLNPFCGDIPHPRNDQCRNPIPWPLCISL